MGVVRSADIIQRIPYLMGAIECPELLSKRRPFWSVAPPLPVLE